MLVRANHFWEYSIDLEVIQRGCAEVLEAWKSGA